MGDGDFGADCFVDICINPYDLTSIFKSFHGFIHKRLVCFGRVKYTAGAVVLGESTKWQDQHRRTLGVQSFSPTQRPRTTFSSVVVRMSVVFGLCA